MESQTLLDHQSNDPFVEKNSVSSEGTSVKYDKAKKLIEEQKNNSRRENF